MPDTPEENDQQNSFEVPPKERDTSDEQKQRRQDEAPLETVEQHAIAVSADHTGQVMTHCAERRDKEINVLRTPFRLGQRKGRNQQQRRSNVQNQVAPRVQYPQLRLRPYSIRGRRRNSLQT